MTTAASTPLKVLIVDDSAFMRKVISDMVEADQELMVVGRARSGEEALQLARKYKPDVITMDLEMPGMSGLEALKTIHEEGLGEVLMLSGHTTEGAHVTLEALEAGAYDFVSKPSVGISLDMERIRRDLISKLKVVPTLRGGVKLKPSLGSKLTPKPMPQPPRLVDQGPKPQKFTKVVVIATSTGGPKALKMVLPSLSARVPACYLVIQHMPKGFTQSLAQRLDRECEVEVFEGRPGLTLAPGRVIVAPGGFHMEIGPDGTIKTFVGETVNGVMPAADVTMVSVAERFGKDAIGVVLTGMGRDGTAGARAIHAAGGQIMVEDKSTAVVWGMPRSVWEEGLSHEVHPIDEISERLMEMISRPGGTTLAR